MNLAQRIVLAVGAIAIAVMALFPPWNYVYDYPGNARYVNRPAYQSEHAAGYHAIWKVNTPTDQTYLALLFSIPTDERSSLQYFSIRLNASKLLVQLAATIVITVILTVFAHSRRHAGWGSRR